MKCVVFFLIIFHFESFSIPQKSFKLDSNLKDVYLHLLEKATDFHQVIERGNQKEIQKEVRATQQIIATIYTKILSIPHFQQRIHTYKLLKKIEEQLTIMQSNKLSTKVVKKKTIQKLFNSFFELAQVYDLKKDMKSRIFYCSMDKSLWFQPAGKAKNPINSSYKNCGRLIL